MKRLLPILAAAAWLCGCASVSSDLNKINLGMSRNQVVHQLGQPHSVGAEQNVVILTYFMRRENMGGMQAYIVKLVNGQVVMYGEKGDFDRTETSKKRIQAEAPETK